MSASMSRRQLLGLFVTPAMMTSEAWDVAAEAIGWVQRNADVLADSRGIGGDPGKGEVYGFASWTPRMGIVALRNPTGQAVPFADGTRVEIPELLDLARKAARDAIAGEFRGDNLSTLYYVWANLYGASEQAWDDARLVVQIGGESESAMEVARGHGIFVVDGARCRLAVLADRAGKRNFGMDQNPPLIDALHRAMLFWKGEKRAELVAHLAERDLLEDGPFWKLGQALFEVLPRDGEDWKLVNALLGERQTLRTEGKRKAARDGQATLFSGNSEV